MQQGLSKQEERYADGFGEYSNFYGGPSYAHLASTKAPAPSTRQLLLSHQTPTPDNRRSAATEFQHAVAYNLAANIPEIRREAEGLQLAYTDPSSGAHAPYHLTPYGCTREAEGLQLTYQPNNGYPKPIPSGYAIAQNKGLRLINPTRNPMVPEPLTHRRKSSETDPSLYHFPQPPHSPQSPQSPSSSTSLQHPLFRKSETPRHLPEISAPPPPLKFQRAKALPPTPPQSIGAKTAEDALRDKMQSLNISDTSGSSSKHASGRPKLPPGTLSRMDTMHSVSSGRSSSTPGSTFGQHQRISIARTNTNSSSNMDQGPPGLSAAEARTEVLRLLEKAEESLGPAPKKGFSLKRSNTAKPANNASHSQEALANVLESVAEQGELPLVKAVISLGADPVYRSNGKLKKIKHEALTKASAAGKANVVDFLLHKGASYGDPQKKDVYTPLDRALLTAVYNGHAELAIVLIESHGANPMVEQWPREMDDAQHYWAQLQLRLSKKSVLDRLSHWKNEEEAMSVLKAIMDSPKFDPTAPVSGVFDNQSEIQGAEFSNRPWNTTYAYSALSCFARAGWADAVEAILSRRSQPQDYEKEDEVLQYQDKVTRFVTPVNAITKDTWEQRPEDALRILRLFIERGFNISLAQRTANDLGQRTALARALSANAAQAVELITHNRPELVKEVISFRRNKKETKAQPLAAAIALDKLETARVLLRMGAHPRDPAFDMNVLQFAAHQGGETGARMLAEMINLAPEQTYVALDIAVHGINADCVRVLLWSISAAAARNEIAALPPIWDALLSLPVGMIEETPETKNQYLELISMIAAWDAGHALPPPQLPVVMAAIKRDNYEGMERMLQLGVVDGKSLVLNSKAQPTGDQEACTVLECAEATQRSSEWLGLLREWGAPLFT